MNFDLRADEEKFLDLIRNNEPISLQELAELCKNTFDWKKATTYAVLSKLINEGSVKNENSLIKVESNKIISNARIHSEGSLIEHRTEIEGDQGNTLEKSSIDDKKSDGSVGKVGDSNEFCIKPDGKTLNYNTVMAQRVKEAKKQFYVMLVQIRKTMEELGIDNPVIWQVDFSTRLLLEKVKEVNKKFLSNIDSIIESSSIIGAENHMKPNAGDLHWKLEVDADDIMAQKVEADKYCESLFHRGANFLFTFKKITDQDGWDLSPLDREKGEDLIYILDEMDESARRMFIKTNQVLIGITKHQFNVTIDQARKSGYDPFVQEIERRIYALAKREKEINKDYSDELSSIESRSKIITDGLEKFDDGETNGGMKDYSNNLMNKMADIVVDLELAYRAGAKILHIYLEKKRQYGPNFDKTKDNELSDQLQKFGRKEKQVYIQMNQLFVSEESENEKSASEEFKYENTEEQQINEHRPADVIRMSVWDDKTESHQKGKGDSEKQMNEQKGKSMKDTEPNPDLT